MKYMHDYAVIDHDREIIGRYLGIFSWILPPIIAGFLSKISETTGWSWVLSFTMSSSLIYIILNWLFKTKIWKIKLLTDILKISDLNGNWKLEGQTLNEKGEVTRNWTGSWQVEQDWKKILIYIKTEESDSKSYTATLYRNPASKAWHLAYSYTNDPFQKNPELNTHRGFCEIEFNKDLTEGSGTYFNSRGRRTFGNIKLERKYK